MAEKIAKALSQNELKFAKELVHGLKGEAGTLEATRLFLATKNLESQLFESHLLEANNLEQNEYLSELTQALNDVLLEIGLFEKETGKAVVNKNSSRINSLSGQKLDIESLTIQFHELAELLQDNNLRAKTLAKTISPKLSVSKYCEQWDTLLNALSELDFETALQILLKLSNDLGISL